MSDHDIRIYGISGDAVIVFDGIDRAFEVEHMYNLLLKLKVFELELKVFELKKFPRTI